MREHLKRLFFDSRSSGEASTGRGGKLRRPGSRSGAVAVEFAVAVVPTLACFFCFTQVAQLFTAYLMIQHAANVAARCAVVSLDRDTINPGPGKINADVQTGAQAAVGPFMSRFDSVGAMWQSNASEGDQYGLVRVTVIGNYKCEVPMGGQIVCPGGRSVLRGEATLPMQGARYKLD